MPTAIAKLIVAIVALALLAVPAQATPKLLVNMDNLQVLYAEDAGVTWHPASLTKLMTAYVTFEAIGAGRISLDTPVTLSKAAINQAPSKSGLKVGASLTLKDALYVMLVKSANDVAWSIAETVGGDVPSFVRAMNDAARRMGLTATHFVDPNGLTADGQVTTARDLAVLALYIRQNYPQYDDIFRTETVVLGKSKLESNNDLLTKFEGITGMKTGFICASGLNIVATINRDGKRLLAVVLGGSSARERGEMTAELFLRGLSGALIETGQGILSLPNRGGEAVNMRSMLCGKDAKAYVAGREADFPMGLKGKPSYLTDVVNGLSYIAVDLGSIVTNVPLPRPRPGHAPLYPSGDVASATSVVGTTFTPNLVPDGAPVPFPRPRP